MLHFISFNFKKQNQATLPTIFHSKPYLTIVTTAFFWCNFALLYFLVFCMKFTISSKNRISYNHLCWWLSSTIQTAKTRDLMRSLQLLDNILAFASRFVPWIRKHCLFVGKNDTNIRKLMKLVLMTVFWGIWKKIRWEMFSSCDFSNF